MDPQFLGLRAALFDLDGTLVRTFIDFPALRAKIQEISSQYGTGDQTKEISDPLEIVAHMAESLPESAGKQARREALQAIEALEEAGCANPEAIPGAERLLARCAHQGIKVGIVTRNTRRIALGLLERMSLIYDVLVAREDTQRFKPDPAPILAACRLLEVTPASAVMIGDLWTDIAAGKAAGVAVTIGIQWAHDPPNRFSFCRPDVEVSQLSHIEPLLLP